MKTYVAGANSGAADLSTLADVKSYASMGFLQGGVELQSVADVKAFPQGIPEHTACDASGFPHILISFAYDRDHNFFDSKLGYDPPDWLGDSGAFTAWTGGEKIPLPDLIEWCRWYTERKPTFVCISLDVIPGEAGGNREPTVREKKNAIAESLANGDAMRAEGLKIMEVFHVFEPMAHLELLLERRQPGEIVGLGGMVGRSTALKRQFCDTVFRAIRDHAPDWKGIVPLHGLGLTVSSPLAARYPWWSMDASSWIGAAQYGKKITKGGKISGDDSRTKNRTVRHVYLTRVLEGWLAREYALTAMWAQRGVTFAPDVFPAVV